MSARLQQALILIAAFALCLAQGQEEPARSEKPGKAGFKVHGYGFWGNLRLKKLLYSILEKQEDQESFYSVDVEDGGFILLSAVRDEGYLSAKARCEVVYADGETESTSVDRHIELKQKPVRFASFFVETGPLYHYESVEFEGLRVLKPKEAKAFFIAPDMLISQEEDRIYTPDRLRRSLENLKVELRQKGYAEAKAEVLDLQINDAAGEVFARIAVDAGLLFQVRDMDIRIQDVENLLVERRQTNFVDTAYSNLWRQDFQLNLQNQYQRKGFPDARMEMAEVEREARAEVVKLDLRSTLYQGHRVEIGEVKLKGYEKTKPKIIRRKIPFEQGDPLNVLDVEKARYQLARKGVFNSVQVNYLPVTDTVRDVEFVFEEATSVDASVLFGYGSYELLRGSFELDQNNIFGLGHQSRLILRQSFKSSSVDYNYLMPEILNTSNDGVANVFARRREEPSFDRREYGGSAGIQRYFEGIDSHFNARYAFESLNARDNDFEEKLGNQSALAAYINLDLSHDRRDNPLYPKTGYHVYQKTELASEVLGGDVNYVRVEAGGSRHFDLEGGRLLHFGIRHGWAWTPGEVSDDLPVNKRFFMGGENTVRGFQQGEASPLNDKGESVGSETYLMLNVEAEQFLTRQISLVAFADGIGFARSIGDYPFGRVLVSVGGGLRFKTIVGPIRLEYGHNLNPRGNDPSGTIHFSVGFPF